jgi:hypothetical protein
MATYQVNDRSTPPVTLPYQPQSQGTLPQVPPVFQYQPQRYPVNVQGSQSAYSPYHPQNNHLAHNYQTSETQSVGLAPNPGQLDPGATPRLEHALHCLYATLSISIPIYILQITTLFEPFGSLWIVPVILMFTLIFSSTVAMVTFRDRARMHPNSRKPPPMLPAICRLPTIIFCFLIVVVWLVGLAMIISNMVLLDGVVILVSYYRFPGMLWVILGSLETVCILAQMGLLLAIGILGAVERKHAKRHLRASLGYSF